MLATVSMSLLLIQLIDLGGFVFIVHVRFFLYEFSRNTIFWFFLFFISFYEQARYEKGWMIKGSFFFAIAY